MWRAREEEDGGKGVINQRAIPELRSLNFQVRRSGRHYIPEVQAGLPAGADHKFTNRVSNDDGRDK